jgi:hypothetical protein
MTEAEWLACRDSGVLLPFVEHHLGERKFRLFAVACANRLIPHFASERCVLAIEAAERYADGLAEREELAAVAQEFEAYLASAGPTLLMRNADHVVRWVVADDCRLTASHAAGAAGNVAPPAPGSWSTGYQTEHAHQCAMLRDITGNPFKPAAVDTQWRTETARALARTMYDSRDFSAMPILADALQDAGCDSDDILNHCRDAYTTHVRGCWVVDLVLGKE